MPCFLIDLNAMMRLALKTEVYQVEVSYVKLLLDITGSEAILFNFHGNFLILHYYIGCVWMEKEKCPWIRLAKKLINSIYNFLNVWFEED